MGKIFRCLGVCLFSAAALFGQSEADFEVEITGTEESQAITITKYLGTSPRVRIPDTVEGLPVRAIGNLAFSTVDRETKQFSGMGITEVIIPDTVMVIGDYAFYHNELESVMLPEGLTVIGDVAFAENKLFVGCGEGAVEVLVIQPIGKSKMSVADFLRGYADRLGETFIKE